MPVYHVPKNQIDDDDDDDDDEKPISIHKH